MSDSLKKDTISALVWNTLDKVGFQMLALIVGIITARLLSPRDFGLIGALAVFVMLSNILVESGFTTALIRRKKNTDEEYSAMLYFNILLSIVIYLILFFSAPQIANFFHMPELSSLARLLFLAIILNSFGLVQNIILTKELAFRTLTIANIISAFVSGIICISLILFWHFDYWALAWQQVIQIGVRVIMLWILSSWRPVMKANFLVIKEVFSFSILMLTSALINSIMKNIYNVIIGRTYNAQVLGYYTQANKFQLIPSNVILLTMSGVTYPVLSKLNDDTSRQLMYFRKIIRITAFLIFPIMIGLLAMTEELVQIVLTDKWLPAAPYFKILVLAALVSPFHTLNLNILTLKGFAKTGLSLEVFRNILIILSLFFCLGNIESMLIGFSAASFISYFADIYIVRRKTGYDMWDQIKDVLPYAGISVAMYFVIKGVGLINLGIYTTSALQILSAVIFYYLILKALGSQVLIDAVDFFKSKTN